MTSGLRRVVAMGGATVRGAGAGSCRVVPARASAARAFPLLAAALTACGGGPGPVDPCGQDRVPELEDPGALAPLLATVTVLERVDEGAEDEAELTGLATATFADRSVYDADATAAFAFGEGCVPGGDPALCACLGIIGRPVVRRELMPLEVQSAVVRGARGGDLELSRRAAGHLLWAGEGPLFDADEVTVEVEGRAPAGVVLVREEGTWTSSELGARRLWAAWVAPGGERVAVGAGGAVALDGAAGLELVEVGVEADLTAVHGTDAAELWVVGSGGAILRMAGGQWELEEGGTAERLEAILAHDGDVFAAGAGGTVLRRDGSGRWRAEETGTSADLYGLAAGPSGEVLAVGSGGTLLRRVAGSWETEPTGTSAELRAVAATEDGTIVAVGRGGFAVGVDGRGPRAEVTGTTRDLHAVAADGALVLAAGIGGTVLAREPGGRWSALEVGVGSDLHAVAVGPWGDALFVGFSGTFPSFTATARVPEGLGDPSLTASESGGAVVEWGGSGGGYVDITLRAGVDDDPSRTNRLRCIVRDDGCHGIGQDAIGWLVSGTTGDLEVRVERHEMQFAVVDGQSAVAFGLVRAHGFSVEL